MHDVVLQALEPMLALAARRPSRSRRKAAAPATWSAQTSRSPAPRISAVISASSFTTSRSRVGQSSLGEMAAECFEQCGVGDQCSATAGLRRRFQDLATRLVLGQRTDSRRRKKKSGRDLQREELLDQRLPVLRVPAIEEGVSGTRACTPPCTCQERCTSKRCSCAVLGMAEGEAHAGPFVLARPMVDRLAEEVVVVT